MSVGLLVQMTLSTLLQSFIIIIMRSSSPGALLKRGLRVTFYKFKTRKRHSQGNETKNMGLKGHQGSRRRQQERKRETEEQKKGQKRGEGRRE
jgi:hypothetical protein